MARPKREAPRAVATARKGKAGQQRSKPSGNSGNGNSAKPLIVNHPRFEGAVVFTGRLEQVLIELDCRGSRGLSTPEACDLWRGIRLSDHITKLKAIGFPITSAREPCGVSNVARYRLTEPLERLTVATLARGGK